MASAEWPRSNMLWRWFTEPRWRDSVEPTARHESTSHSLVADLRVTLAPQCENTDALELWHRLLAVSDYFARTWAEHRATAEPCAPKRIEHDDVGRIDLETTVVRSTISTQRLVLMQPARSDQLSAERLSRLVR
ncbi:hypothetical protein HH310_14810 [Actinoplanes sp. TBRC 11911]|uniref:MmyB family transcriptional regulator n=1 Tax=Actinoplanes sp. TBRC 11911 TaxID=2729386 RepID=UPI00145F3044|nr:hypothetical protein [Actinoplanes sp. TBRC 11911]NMO52458.1 hypothetical protein [Actinoplanes sp. TBRC 11911]